MPMPKKAKSHRASSRAFSVIAAAWLSGVLGLFIVWLLAPDSLPDGQCSGLGFGCTLTARDSIAFAGFFFALPVTIFWFVAGAIATSLFGRFSTLSWQWIALISLGICIATGVLAIGAVVMLF
ncbi:hypothetical protein [Brevibacterium spongiae]|uniref:Vitamin K epoxide reductase family protein n=1 Tax=Brevibacterium spongiae TaxID=2909672 RepID=A0ABY5SLC7_9MICO|nr:hypothetical protein [Brevibacterium spongiae]UVI34766.1 hypothetical protein L1F31_11585 [Brevibacterium spongiae]